MLKVNVKTLTVPSPLHGAWTQGLPYDKVTARRRDGVTTTRPDEPHPSASA